MAIHISEPGHPVGTRLPQSFRARRVTGKDQPEATRPTASNTDAPLDPGHYRIEQQQVRRALQEYQEEPRGEPDSEAPYLASAKLASQELFTISARETLRKALETMDQHAVHHLVVISDEGEVAGLIDQHSLLRAFWQQDSGESALASIRLPGFITVTPETDAHHLAQQMLGHQLSAALVIDRNNRPAGVITSTDFLRLYADGHHLHTTI